MNTKQRLSVMVLLLMLFPISLVGQSAEDHIQAALDQALEAGIPLELVNSKVDEGIAKGVAMDAIAAAVQHRLDGLLRAQGALADIPDVEAADLEVAADALGEGVSEAVLSAIAESEPRERRWVAIVALTYLYEEGMVPGEALARVEAALSRGPDALQNLPPQAQGPGIVEPPVGQAGPPSGIPAPGSLPAQGQRDNPGPPNDLPGPPGQNGPPEDVGPPADLPR
jgi:hypothetical protein